MKKILIFMGAVLILSTSAACSKMEGASTNTSTNDGFTIAGDQGGQTPPSGSASCDPNKKVRIQVAVSGGTSGAAFTVNAFCGGTFLGSSTATDPGNGTTGTKTTTHTQVAGLGSCTPMATTSPTWSYICDFNR